MKQTKLTKTEQVLLAECRAQNGRSEVDTTQTRRFNAYIRLKERGLIVRIHVEKCRDQKYGAFGRTLQGCFKHYTVFVFKLVDQSQGPVSV